MAQQVNEGTYRISGRFGEAFILLPERPPMRLFEATAVTFTVEIGQEEVPIAGSNRSGVKDGPESRTDGAMTIQKLDSLLENHVYGFLNYSLRDRRRARDAGQRITRTFTMQVWLDDPDALGAEGWQLEGCRLSRLMGGFNISDIVTNRDHPFRWEAERKIKAFERIGNDIDDATGLPRIRYTDDLAPSPGTI
jgi:hypothetical protein